MRRFVTTLVAFGAVIGMKFYNKSSSHDDVRSHLVKLCEGNAGCEQAVATHFEACFDAAYHMGGRYQSSRLESAKLVQCINSKAGRSYFTYSEKE
jgi:hypothetical protein